MRTLLFSIFVLGAVSCVSIGNKNQLSSEHLLLEGKDSIGVILCHGGGAHPDWKVVGSLRRSLNGPPLNAHTLSLLMPTSRGDWKNYLNTFPEAVKILRAGARTLKGLGATKIVLIGHSMGSRMASYFLANEKDHGVDLFVGLGMRNNGGKGLNVISNLKQVQIPVLDIYGTRNKEDYRFGQARKKRKFPHLEQVIIKGANHKFTGYDAEVEEVIRAWILK